MPIRYWILKQANITYARWEDRIDVAELRRNFEEYLKDADYQVGRPELIDLRFVTVSTVDLGGVTMLLNKANAQDFDDKPGTLTSVLATDETRYGTARQYQSLAQARGGIEVHVSDTEAEALAILGRPERTIDAFLRSQTDYP